MLSGVEAVDEIEDGLAAGLRVDVHVDQAVVGGHALRGGSADAVAALDGEEGMDVLRTGAAIGHEDGALMVFGGDGHAGHGVAFEAGDVDHVGGLGDDGGEIESEVAFGEDERVGLVGHGFLAAVGAGAIDEADAGECFGAAVEDGGGDIADGVVEGDVGGRGPDLLDELASRRVASCGAM